MDRSKKLDKQTLYDIYRACRLCGAGAGYKMPIIQNLVQVDSEEVELKQKIRECLQLEVNSDDKMPPLICELCVDKLDDFYEFLTTCRQTNANTRKRLGLPLQDTPIAGAAAKVTPVPAKVTPAPSKVIPAPKKVISKDIGTETCMLGLIEASKVKQDIYIVSSRSEGKKGKSTRVNKKEEMKEETTVTPETPITSSPALKDIKQNKDIKQGKERDSKRRREQSPKRTKRHNNSSDEVPLTKVQEATKTTVNRPGPKSRKVERKEDPPPKVTRAKEKDEPPPEIAKKEDDPSKCKGKRDRDDEPLTKLKRVREKDAKRELTPPPTKKAKTSEPLKPPQLNKPQKSSKSSPKSVQATTVSKSVQPDGIPCPACNAVLKNIVGFKNHMHYVHPVTWTPDNLACNACHDWFSTIEESVAHHKKHTNYKCLRCKKRYRTGVLYHQHMESKRCLPEQEVPDVKCDACWRTFPTGNLMKEHRCPGQDGRVGGKCSKCYRNYALLKNLTKHESTCLIGKKVVVETQPVVDPEVEAALLPMEVRITKCDDLLQYGPTVSACTVPHRYGLDRKMSYPYMPKLRVIKKPIYNPMVSIQDEVKEEFNKEDFNWTDFEDIENKTVKKLSTLCLKVIFSSKMLGELEIIDEVGIARCTALKKRIESIIYKFDDASSTNSDSILDKHSIAKTFEVVNDKIWPEDKNYHSDSTVFDETTVAGEEDTRSDSKMDDLVDNHDKSDDLDTYNDRIGDHKLKISILSHSDVDINKRCGTSIANMEKPSNKPLESCKTLRDDVTNYLSTVNEEQLENSELVANKLKMVINPTDVNVNDILLEENMRFDNIKSANDSPSIMNTENSRNDHDSANSTESDDVLTKNDDILCKKDVTPREEPRDSVNGANDSSRNHETPSINENDSTDHNSHTESMEKDAKTNNLDSHSVSNEDTMKNPQNGNSNDNDLKSLDDDKKTELENMDIDETYSVNSINFENTTQISENSNTDSIGKVSYTKIGIYREQSVDSYTKTPEVIKNTNSSTENNTNHDIVQNIKETETKSPEKANKTLDFSVTGILNHVTSKVMDTDLKNVGNDRTAIRNSESIENDTKQGSLAQNDKHNDNNQFSDSLSLNKNNDNSTVNDIDDHSKNDPASKNDDRMSLNSISTTFTEKSDDAISLNSQYAIENVNKSDKFNVNNLSEDERKLMAEIDDQIGETNDKIDKLSDGRDLNLENFSDGYNFD